MTDLDALPVVAYLCDPIAEAWPTGVPRERLSATAEYVASNPENPYWRATEPCVLQAAHLSALSQAIAQRDELRDDRDSWRDQATARTAEAVEFAAQRDAAFAMSRCECSSSEACANLVAKDAQIAQLQAENERLRADTLEEAAKACEAEHLNEPQAGTEDIAYDFAVRDCAAAVRALAAGGAQTKGAR